MSWGILNIKSSKKCAICKHWFDPAGTALKPHMGDFLQFDQNAKKPCLKHGQTIKPSWAQCNEFESKV
ncbi:MAG: hypothetical protein KKD38_02675 [Candidatus Delongbacteria bacterium]|nr:hypothetical protein [Candidatus Delongbacteria bacterium]MCG2761019.1 hypothetical protein [Candidatus Delongbacteria bacterium]